VGIFGDSDDERPSIRVLAKQAKKSDDPRQAADLLAAAGAQAIELGKTRKALSLLRQALEKAADHGPASAYLEAILQKQGDDEALHAEQVRRIQVLTEFRGDAREVAATHARLAQTEERLDRLGDAFANYTRSFELDPSQIGVAQAARRLAIKTERWEEAVAILEREVAVEPDRARRAELFRKRARTTRDKLGRLDDAIQLFERAVRTTPGDIDTRRELVDTLLLRAETTKDPDRTSRDRYVAADILVDLVKAVTPDEQTQFVLEALEVAPEHLPALELLEEIAADDVELLLVHWARHVEAFPDGPRADDVRWRLAKEHLAAGRAEKGLSWFEDLARRGDAEAMLRAVELHDAAGRHIDARRWARASLEVVPGEEQIGLHQRLFELLAAGDPVGAEHHAFALLAADPDDDASLKLIIAVREAAGDRSTLAEVYADVCARSPGRRHDLLPTLGLLLEEVGDVEAALVCFREAETLLDGPDAARARSEHVRLAELAGEWDELADLLEDDVRGLSSTASIPILEKLATMHRGLRADTTRATDALLSLLSLVNEDRLTGVHRDLSATLESAGAGSLALDHAQTYARSAAPELRTSLFQTLGRLHDSWGETDLAADAWNLVRATRPEDEEALERSIVLAVTQERYRPAVELLEFFVSLKSGPQAIALHRRIAEIADEHLSDVDRAADALTAALDISPEDRALALETVEALRRAKRFGEEKIVHKVLVTSAPDAKSRRTHQERIARLSASQLQDPDEALRVWTQLVNDTEDATSLEKLRDDARSEGDAARLDVILARLAAVETDPGKRSEHALERAKILALDLGRPQLALRVLAHAAASYAQGHLPSHEYLESLAEDVGDQRTLARALEGQAPLVDARRKRYVLRQLADLYEGPLQESTGMTRALSRWEEVSPDEIDPRLRIIPVLAERGDWGGLLKRLDELIALSRKDTQKWIDQVTEAATTRGDEPNTEDEKRQRENARAWFLIEAAGRAEAPAQRLRLVVGAADRFETSERFDEAFTATTRALEMVGAREELLDRAERFAEAADLTAKLDALYEKLVTKAPTEEDRVTIALRHARYLSENGRMNDAVDRLLRASASAPTNEPLLDELELLAPRSERMDDLMAAYVDRGNLVGGERAVQLLCRGATVAYRAGKPEAVRKMVREAVNQAGDDDALLDRVEEAAGKLGREGTEQLVRVYEARGNDTNAPPRARAKALVRAALRMKEKLGLQEVAFGVLKTALKLAPTEKRVLDAIEDSAAERGLIGHLDQHLAQMVTSSTDRREAAVLVARQAKIREEHLGRPEEAAEEYMRSISMNPDDEWVLRRLRFCLIETGRVQDLIGVLERRLGRLSDDAERVRQLRQLAKLWEDDAGNAWEALDTWKRVLKIAPADPQAKEAVSRLAKKTKEKPAPKAAPAAEETTQPETPTIDEDQDDEEDEEERAETTETRLPDLAVREEETTLTSVPDLAEDEEELATVAGVPDLADDDTETTQTEAPRLREADTDEREVPEDAPEEKTSRSERPVGLGEKRSAAPPPVPAAAKSKSAVPPPIPAAAKAPSAAPPPIPEEKTSRSAPPLPPNETPRSAPPPIPDTNIPSIAEARKAEEVAEAETAEIVNPPPRSKPPPDEKDLPSIIVDPELLED